jgi:N-acetylmuramoyl-L-alanine amidase
MLFSVKNAAWSAAILCAGLLTAALFSPAKNVAPILSPNSSKLVSHSNGSIGAHTSFFKASTPHAANQTPLVQASPNSPYVVVLDPAHGGADPGARGTGGIRESDIVLDFAAQTKRTLEAQGFQVMQTRQGNDNPSFDDRSSLANAQRKALFITIHIASTGVPGTVRVYVNSDLPAATDSNGLIPWDRAQAPFIAASRKFGDLVQASLSPRFKGSPDFAQIASVRQLRTTAAPSIAVEISSVTVDDRSNLDWMAPGVAEAIAQGASAFRVQSQVPVSPGVQP